jgi:hypothetical protein
MGGNPKSGRIEPYFDMIVTMSEFGVRRKVKR